MPVLAAGLALTAVGTGLSMAANAQDQSAINSAKSAELKAQQGYQNQASSVFNKQLPNDTAATANNQIAEGQAQRQNVFHQLQQLSQPKPAVPSVASAPAQQASERASSAGNAWSNAMNTNQSRLGGYGDWNTALGVSNSGVNSQLGVINNEAAGRAKILPLQVEAASHKGDALSSWGRIIGALGSLTSAAGAGSSSGGDLSNISNGQAPGGGTLYGTQEVGDI